jgi:DNA invertase Pin-like site-specific DNA recombinase
MTVAAYVRVSTRHQKDDGQRAEIKKWLDSTGIDPAQVRWYADKETGTTLRRPAFEQLQADIFHGKVKTVVMWKLDRLSRRLKDGVVTLADWCDRGLKIVVVTQQLEFNGPVGRTLAALLLGLAEIENEYRRERQAAGIVIAKKKGVYKGRAKGTTKSKPARAMELRDKGLTAPEIATALGVSERTVFRYLVGVEMEGGGIMAAARRPGVIKDGHEIAGVTDHDRQD